VIWVLALLNEEVKISRQMQVCLANMIANALFRRNPPGGGSHEQQHQVWPLFFFFFFFFFCSYLLLLLYPCLGLTFFSFFPFS